jgi:hypothetical protein
VQHGVALGVVLFTNGGARRGCRHVVWVRWTAVTVLSRTRVGRDGDLRLGRHCSLCAALWV